MKASILRSYDFSDGAIGLADILSEAIATNRIADHELFTIKIRDQDGRFARKANIVRAQNKDGSTFIELLLDMDLKEK